MGLRGTTECLRRRVEPWTGDQGLRGLWDPLLISTFERETAGSRRFDLNFGGWVSLRVDFNLGGRRETMKNRGARIMLLAGRMRGLRPDLCSLLGSYVSDGELSFAFLVRLVYTPDALRHATRLAHEVAVCVRIRGSQPLLKCSIALSVA